MTEENTFFEHIARKIASLARAYHLAHEHLQEIIIEGGITVASADIKNVNYTIIVNRLNRAITDFKKEMALSLKDYYLLRDMGALTENATRHIEGKLQDLKEEYKALDKKIPENILKKGLGQNYKFHQFS